MPLARSLVPLLARSFARNGKRATGSTQSALVCTLTFASTTCLLQFVSMIPLHSIYPASKRFAGRPFNTALFPAGRSFLRLISVKELLRQAVPGSSRSAHLLPAVRARAAPYGKRNSAASNGNVDEAAASSCPLRVQPPADLAGFLR